MCNYPKQNDIWLETSGGQGGAKEAHTHTQRKIYGHDTAQTHTREPKKPMRMTQSWHVIFLKLVLFGVDAGVIACWLQSGATIVQHFIAILVISDGLGSEAVNHNRWQLQLLELPGVAQTLAARRSCLRFPRLRRPGRPRRSPGGRGNGCHVGGSLKFASGT